MNKALLIFVFLINNILVCMETKKSSKSTVPSLKNLALMGVVKALKTNEYEREAAKKRLPRDLQIKTAKCIYPFAYSLSESTILEHYPVKDSDRLCTISQRDLYNTVLDSVLSSDKTFFVQVVQAGCSQRVELLGIGAFCVFQELSAIPGVEYRDLEFGEDDSIIKFKILKNDGVCTACKWKRVNYNLLQHPIQEACDLAQTARDFVTQIPEKSKKRKLSSMLPNALRDYKSKKRRFK